VRIIFIVLSLRIFLKNKLTEKSEKYQKILIASLERKIPSKKFV